MRHSRRSWRRCVRFTCSRRRRCATPSCHCTPYHVTPPHHATPPYHARPPDHATPCYTPFPDAEDGAGLRGRPHSGQSKWAGRDGRASTATPRADTRAAGISYYIYIYIYIYIYRQREMLPRVPPRRISAPAPPIPRRSPHHHARRHPPHPPHHARSHRRAVWRRCSRRCERSTRGLPTPSKLRCSTPRLSS